MTTEHQASRTLVKSTPELWAECSDAASLARHLGEFGEIRITKLERETAVAWEGERVRGTVRLEPSGWGTRVTLTAAAATAAASARAAAVSDPDPRAPEPPPFAPRAQAAGPNVADPRRSPRAGLFARMVGRFGNAQAPTSTPDAPRAVPEPAPSRSAPAFDAAAILVAALDSLGQAHHRPFSRD